jgi:hypothetical protein
MTTEPLREHLEWHLRRLKSARAAAAERSLQAESDGLQWLSLTHFAVLALEATLSEEVAPDHRALEEFIADLAGSSVRRDPGQATPDPAESWTTAIASFSALAFPSRPPARTFAKEHEPPAESAAAPFAAP